MEEKAYIFGTVFILANKLQVLGDRLDRRLTVKQWLFLAGITACESGAPTLSELAARIGSSRQNVKKMAVLLEAQGFVAVNRDDSDARALRLTLTDSCREHFRRREHAEIAFIESLFEGFGAGELRSLARAFRKLERTIARAMRDETMWRFAELLPVTTEEK